MSKTVVIASALGLAAIVGLGTYELTARKNNDSLAPPSQSQAFVSPTNTPSNSSDASLPPGSTGMTTTTYIAPHVTGPGQISESTTKTNSPNLLPPGRSANELPPVNQANSLPPANPANSLPPGYSTNSLPPGTPANVVSLTPQAAPTQSTYTQTTTRIARPHTAYVTHTVKYQKKGKIHVARGLKHTAEFAVKMPGRLTL